MPAKNPSISQQNAERLKALGARIRAQRKQLDISALVAAEAAGMSRVTWYRIEKGEPAVTMGAWLNAATAVGLVLGFPRNVAKTTGESWIPVRVPLDEYPELKKLAWHIGDGGFLSAREAFDIYERNERHLDMAAMTVEEGSLLEGLRQAFSGGDSRNG